VGKKTGLLLRVDNFATVNFCCFIADFVLSKQQNSLLKVFVLFTAQA